jgi:hypothetical protein
MEGYLDMAGTTPINAWPYPTDTDYVYLGAQAIESLADSIDTSVGSGLLAWVSYTPVLTATTTNPTIGSSVFNAAYCKIGKTVHVRLNLTIGAGFVVGSGAYLFSLPVAPSGTALYAVPGIYTDSSTSNIYRVTGTTSGSTINRSYYGDGGSVFLSSAAPVIPALNDSYRYNFSYEVA